MIETVSNPPAPNPALEATDESLLLQYRNAGCVESFEMLVHRYEKPLFNYLQRYLQSTSLAEDVFQATFLRLHEKRHVFTEGRHFRPWLYRMATHLAIDALRREGRHRMASLDQDRMGEETDVGSLQRLLRSHSPSPLEQMAADERARWTRRAVNDLPELLRVVVLLAYFQGLKFQEVAEILHLPLGTVKSRLHKALVMLNAAWRKNHLDAPGEE